MSQLVPCPECQRHVRKTEARCPFCDEALALAHLPPPALPTRRLGRAATFAFGASVAGVTALVGCEVTLNPMYGAPPAGMGGMNANGVAGTNAGGFMSYGGAASYGAPPSGATNGGNLNQGGSAQPVYGAPAAGTGNEPSAGAGGESLSAVYGAPPGGDGPGGAGGAGGAK
jgi:hypothetical protein